MKNPYTVRIVYFTLGAILGITLGCGGKPTSNPGPAKLIVIENPVIDSKPFKGLIFGCVEYTNSTECLELLKANDGEPGKIGPQGVPGKDGADGVDGVDGKDKKDDDNKSNEEDGKSN